MDSGKMASITTHNNEDQPHIPIAICGISIRLPGGICNADQFWESVVNERGSHGPVKLDGSEDGHDLKKGMRPFDTSFFSMTDEEAKKCSPQQQRFLEVARECFEDACEVNYRGEDACVGCYVGTSNENDASIVSFKNDLQGPRFVSKSIVTQHKSPPIFVADMLTFHFHRMITNSSLVAFHEAYCAVQSGKAKSAIVVASSVMPISEDGAEKDEAVSAVYIKTLPDAIRDGNPIHAVIRASTVASIAASRDQESAAGAFVKLILEAYAAADLNASSTLLVQVSKTMCQIQAFEPNFNAVLT